MHAVPSVTPVPYGEIVASIASRSAGPGTGANTDELTETNAKGIGRIGGAGTGEAFRRERGRTGWHDSFETSPAAQEDR